MPAHQGRPQSLLILHLDSDKLRADHLHLGDVAAFSSMIATLALGSDAVSIDVDDSMAFENLLRVAVEDRRAFDVIVVVAHGNAFGLQVAQNRFDRWEEFAKNLSLLRPRRLLLAACQAGRYDAGEALFRSNPRLRRIFACPVNASRDFATLMLLAVPWIVSTRKLRERDLLTSKFAAVLLTGCQLREWRRSTDRGNPDRPFLDVLSVAADPFARAAPRVARSIVGALFRRG